MAGMTFAKTDISLDIDAELLREEPLLGSPTHKSLTDSFNTVERSRQLPVVKPKATLKYLESLHNLFNASTCFDHVNRTQNFSSCCTTFLALFICITSSLSALKELVQRGPGIGESLV